MTVGLPENVARQIEQGEAIQQEVYGNPDEQSAANKGNDKPVEKNGENPAAAAQDPGKVDWEHRFKTYKAATDKTLSEERATVRNQAVEISDLKSANNTLTQQVADLTKQVNSNSDGESLDDDDLDPELKEIIDKQIEPVKKQAEEATKKANDLTEQQKADFKKREDKYWNDVYANVTDENGVSDFEAINESDEFKTWLNEVEPKTGRVRNDDLQAAHGMLDAQTVIAIFNAWKSSQTGMAPATNGDADINYMPDTSRNTETGAQDARIWTATEVSEFFKDKALGKYKDKPDVASAMESDIFVAEREGRIRP